MKRINKIFTNIHIFIGIVMVIHIAIAFSREYFSIPREAAFYLVLIYIPVFIILNGTWILIRKFRDGKQHIAPEQTVSDDRTRLYLNRLTVIFMSINILLTVAATIHSIIATMIYGGSFLLTLVGYMTNYGIPAVIINDVWVVVYMNMKERSEENCQK